jgi:hypothetical protein
MKKALLLFSLLVVLAIPATAAPRDDDPRGPHNVVQRVVLLLKHLFGVHADEPLIGPPKP